MTPDNAYLMTATEIHALLMTDISGENQIKVNRITLTSEQRIGLRFRGYVNVLGTNETLGLCCSL